MESPLYLDAIRAIHLVGLAVGFGLALLADVWAARSFFRPFNTRDFDVMHVLHMGVTVGLGVLWISGLALLYYRTGFDPMAVTPKLMAKLVIVFILTGNAVVITSIAMPLLHLTKGAQFAQNETSIRIQLAMIAGISLGCWLSAFSLGVFSQMKAMDGTQISVILTMIFLTTTIPAFALALLAPWIDRMLHRTEDRETDQPFWRRLAEQAARPAIIVPGLLSFPYRELTLGARKKYQKK